MESPPPSSSSRSSSRSGTRSSRSVRSRSHRSTRPRQSGSCSFRLYSSRGSQSPSPRARSSTPASSHNRSMTFPSSGTRSVTFDESANSRTSYTPTSRSSRSLSPWRHEERVSISPPPPSASRSDHTARSLSPEVEESVQLRGRNLEVHRKMLLKRELWTKGSGWKEKICRDYYLRPDFVLPPSCLPPTAAPPSTGQLPQRRLSDTIRVSPQPATLDDRRLQQHSFTTNTPAASSPPPVKSKSSSSKSGLKGKSPGTKRSLLKKAFKGTVSSVDVDKPGLGQMRVTPSREIAINAPYNLAKVVQMELKNEHGKPLAWALKTNAMERFNAQPRNGILEPGERRKVTLNFHGTVSDPPPTDRIDIIWVDALPGSTFSMDLFFRDGITTGKRVLPVKYNEYSLFPIQGKN